MSDRLISLKAAIDKFESWLKVEGYSEGELNMLKAVLFELRVMPSAQPEPISEVYAKAVFTWLLDYQIKAAELKGRYTPYEVLSWVANDWRKEYERLNRQTGGD